jgi:hypothetical protein
MGLQEESADMNDDPNQPLGVVPLQSFFQRSDGPDLAHCEDDYAD